MTVTGVLSSIFGFFCNIQFQTPFFSADIFYKHFSVNFENKIHLPHQFILFGKSFRNKIHTKINCD